MSASHLSPPRRSKAVEDIKERLTRPLLTRNEALAIALLLGVPFAADFDVEPERSHDQHNQNVAAAPSPAPPTALLIG